MSSASRVLIRLVATMACALWQSIAAPTLHAQVDPRGSMRTISTTHLRIHVRRGQEPLARRAAVIAERAYAQLAAELAPPAGPIDMVIADNVDYSNGYAQVLPTNRVVIFAVPPVGSTELRFHDDWLQLVITHELAHIFHLDRARGLWRAGRFVFGRGPMAFPNALTPSWVKEGLAVHYESRFTGSGRLVSTESRTVARTAARDDVVPPLGRWSLATSRFPQGQTAYGYGALLMDRSAQVGGDTSMRRFVDRTAVMPPFLLNRASHFAFGASFRDQVATMRDSLRSMAVALDRSGDSVWQAITPDGWYAESPRWRSRDSVMWVASNGRDVTGVFVASVRGALTRAPDARVAPPRRIARRNGLDVNAPFGGDSMVFAQINYRGPYEVRSDLYIGVGDDETQITNGARVSQPDVRRDGAIVAIRLSAASTELVRVTRSGVVTPLRGEGVWADPRWSPDGTRVVAIEFLPTGEERVVVMDTVGVVQDIVAGGRAVFASPSFTPDGRRVVYSSDRSGRMQVELAPVAGRATADGAIGERTIAGSAVADTVRWREPRESVRVISRVSSGVYQPSVSPDGLMIVALVARNDGFVVSVAPLDTVGEVARGTWYAATNALNAVSNGGSSGVLAGASNSPDARAGASAVAASATGEAGGMDTTFRRYNPLRQLLPRYWLPQIGTSRLGQSAYGLSTSSSDILERHAWSASVTREFASGETDGVAQYRYRGFGVPVINLSWAQSWDATFRATDTAGVVLGDIARRRRFATVSTSWAAPSIRTSLNGTFGAQYEMRDFFSDVDSLLTRRDILARPRTRYPSFFSNATLSTVRLGNRGISIEEGIAVSVANSYRWREDMPSLRSWRHSATMRGYLPLNLPGFARHVLAGRVAGAITDKNAQTELNVGGVSGVSSELLPGVVFGDPGRTFPVRGVAAAVQRGSRALGGSVEYRAPLHWFRTAASPFTVMLDRTSLTLFTDAARAWCPGALVAQRAVVCERRGVRDGWIASAGAELVVDIAVQYDVPYRLRIGAAAPYAAPAGIARGGSMYVTLGSLF